MQEQTTAIYVRIKKDVQEATSIIASVLGVSMADYIEQAIEARLETDVPDNIAAYEAVRQARERQKKAQEKGA